MNGVRYGHYLAALSHPLSSRFVSIRTSILAGAATCLVALIALSQCNVARASETTGSNGGLRSPSRAASITSTTISTVIVAKYRSD